MSVDRNAVVVVKRDELAETERARKRTGLVRDAFHQAAVTKKYIGVVIDDVVTISVELAGQHLFGNRHADGVSDALTEWTGRGFHAGSVAVLRVARRLRVQLAEVLELIHRQVIARQMQERVDEHRPMTVRQHEAVAIGPFGVRRVVLEEVIPQDLGDVSHAHRRAGVTGVCLLHGVGREYTNRVGEVAAAWRRLAGTGLGGSRSCCHGLILNLSKKPVCLGPAAPAASMATLPRPPTG